MVLLYFWPLERVSDFRCDWAAGGGWIPDQVWNDETHLPADTMKGSVVETEMAGDIWARDGKQHHSVRNRS